MGAFAMPVPASGAPQPQLYAGGTNASGMPVPMDQAGKMAGQSNLTTPPGMGPQRPSGGPVVPLGPSSASGPAQAPNLLNVSQTPGQAQKPVGAPGSNTGTQSGITSRQASRVLGENQNYYGEGMGALLDNYLQTGAGYNGPLAQQMVSSTDQAMQQQINAQFGDLQNTLSNAGLSPNSSASALAQSNFLSNASAQENEVAAQQYMQMYAQSQSLYQNTMMQMAQVNATGTNNQFGNLFSQSLAGSLGSGVGSGLMSLFGL